jgi:DNA-binding MarR family transcriptional regulator
MRRPRPQALEAWSSLLLAHRRLTAELDADLRRSCDMSLDDYDVLLQLREAAVAVRMADLADTLLVSRASTTRLVDRLVERGWVQRWSDEGDRRVVLVELTKAGRAAQARGARVHLDGIARRFDDRLDSVDLEAFAGALRSVAAG